MSTVLATLWGRKMTKPIPDPLPWDNIPVQKANIMERSGIELSFGKSKLCLVTRKGRHALLWNWFSGSRKMEKKMKTVCLRKL